MFNELLEKGYFNNFKGCPIIKMGDKLSFWF